MGRKLYVGSDDEALRAAQVLNGKQYMGRPLTVNEARPREFDAGRPRVHRNDNGMRF